MPWNWDDLILESPLYAQSLRPDRIRCGMGPALDGSFLALLRLATCVSSWSGFLLSGCRYLRLSPLEAQYLPSRDHYQPGLRRYRWKEKDCKRTFHDLTGTRLDGSKRSLAHWLLATFLFCLACSSRRIARAVGVHVRTSSRWCWWLRTAALSSEMQRQLE